MSRILFLPLIIIKGLKPDILIWSKQHNPLSDTDFHLKIDLELQSIEVLQVLCLSYYFSFCPVCLSYLHLVRAKQSIVRPKKQYHIRIYSPQLLGRHASVGDSLGLCLEFWFWFVLLVGWKLHESPSWFFMMPPAPNSFSKQLSTCSIVSSKIFCLKENLIRKKRGSY